MQSDGAYKISGATIARTVVLAFAIVNQILTYAGIPIIPIDDAALTELISNLFLIISAGVAFWKNNSFTQAALAGDETMKAERRLKKKEAEIANEQEGE